MLASGTGEAAEDWPHELTLLTANVVTALVPDPVLPEPVPVVKVPLVVPASGWNVASTPRTDQPIRLLPGSEEAGVKVRIVLPALHDPGGTKIYVSAVRLEHRTEMYNGFMALLKVKTICVFGETPVAPMAGLQETVVAACSLPVNRSTAAIHPSRSKRTNFRSIIVIQTDSGLQFPETLPAELQAGSNA